MKLSETLINIGRPVAYYPKLRKLTKSTTATIFLCQLIYWVGKGEDPEGWIYKTSDEIQEETGLSYEEQKTARRILRLEGLLTERYARIEHQMYFLVNLEALNNKWEQIAPAQRSVPEQGNATEAPSQPLVPEQAIAMEAPSHCHVGERAIGLFVK